MVSTSEELCLERDYYRCRHCASSDNLSAFRISNDMGNNPRLSNLITLCDVCKKSSERIGKIENNKVGIILCGGKGSRLFPITKFINKNQIPIGILPMVFYPIKTMRSMGVRKILIVVDRENVGSIIEMVGSGKEFGLDISFKVQEGANGIADALYLAKEFVKPNEEIYCILGDNIFDNKDVDANIRLNYKKDTKNKACVFLKKVSNPSDYGVAIINDGKVVSIVEKPKNFISDMAVLGLYIYTYDVFSVIEGIVPSKRNELEISSVNDHYASRGLLESHMVSGYWADCGGSIQRYAEASMHGAKEANVSAEEIDKFRSVVFDEK